MGGAPKSDAAARAERHSLVVTYHYVRPQDSDGVTGITPEEFDRQLGLIERTHRFVGVDECVGGADRRPRSGKPVALITFDDGLLDQYRNALPVLDFRAVKAAFFVSMRPVDPALDEREAWTSQHLLHALAERLGWEELESRVRERVGEVSVDRERMDALYHYEVERKRWLKFVLAFVMPADRAAEVLHGINDAAAGPRLSSREWFMSREQLGDLEKRGHALGGHGYDHVAYTTMSPEAQARDMRKAAGLMGELFGSRPRAMAYPYGRHDETTRRLVRECGYTYGFTTEERVDCKDLDRVLREAGRAGEREDARMRA